MLSIKIYKEIHLNYDSSFYFLNQITDNGNDYQQ